MAIVILVAVALFSIVLHRFTLEIPIDTMAGIDVPLWIGLAFLVLLLSWLLEEDRPDGL